MRKIAALLATVGVAALITSGIYHAGFTAGRSVSTYVIDRPLDGLCTLPEEDATKAMEDCFKKAMNHQVVVGNTFEGQCVEGLPCFKGIWKPDLNTKQKNTVGFDSFFPGAILLMNGAVVTNGVADFINDGKGAVTCADHTKKPIAEVIKNEDGSEVRIYIHCGGGSEESK